jgi:hypothetical protein
MKQDNIIFLDIDGVLNHQTAYDNGHCKYVKLMVGNVEDSYSTFCPTSKALLNKLIALSSARN